ncbi:glycosyltransferase family 2 protein [Acinetobacter nematophilus]|uniref:Glycosyltransferase family 2 protein n=1 Tax=Acinetobacter nematophilus TaxID=2994642 RepID=A0A9X3DZN6_9GAMM|nr:glycosyltransferase family 2 protein [Acinetobacter nematophilus]MCX5469847.1 glycosyltransferase family 2 protein [Acinetobacter nematophilus]
MNSNSRISVCLATYNGEKYVREQLVSILKQLSPNDEIIVSDDHSTDKTLSVIESLNDPRIRIIINELGKGYSSNFENAINHSTGDYIFLSDQDDVWIENKVKIMMNELQSFDLVVSDAIISDSFLKPTLGSHFKAHNTKIGFLNNWLKTRYIGACMAFRREIFSKLLPFPSQSKWCAHDYWIANIAEFFFKVKLVDIPLIKYRRHGNNASTGGEKSKNSIFHKIIVRIYTFLQLIKRM